MAEGSHSCGGSVVLAAGTPASPRIPPPPFHLESCLSLRGAPSPSPLIPQPPRHLLPSRHPLPTSVSLSAAHSPSLFTIHLSPAGTQASGGSHRSVPGGGGGGTWRPGAVHLCRGGGCWWLLGPKWTAEGQERMGRPVRSRPWPRLGESLC